jgi:hypothetical protein
MSPSSSSRRFDLTPLGHPLWWGALGLLLVNDRLLKGGGVVPGWLTGKLSDFAFLIVGPVLFAALLPLALPRRRTIALCSVVGLFVATDLSPAASDAFVAVMARLGLASRLWPDPTDLIALAVLPLTIRVMRWPAVSEDAGRARWLRERVGVLLGAAACVATSAPLQHPHSPFLLNAAPVETTIRVTWVLTSATSCTAPEQVAASLDPSDLDDPRDLTLARGQVALLNGPPAAGVSPVGMCPAEIGYSSSGGCGAAILEAPSAPPVLMVAPILWWESEGGAFFSCANPPAPVSRCRQALDPTRDPGPDAVTLKQVPGGLAFVAGEKVALVPVDADAIRARPPRSPGGCRDLRDDYRALAASPTCTTNADCVAETGLGIPGEPGCGIVINRGSSAALAEVSTQWMATCLVSPPRGCTTPIQPAACHDGVCGPACPGVDVPMCPRSCLSQGYNPPDDPCYYANSDPWRCTAKNGDLCSCKDGKLDCPLNQTVAPGCPLKCLDWPGGGTVSDSASP